MMRWCLDIRRWERFFTQQRLSKHQAPEWIGGGPLEIDMVVVDIFHGQQLLPGMNSSPRLLWSMSSAREYNIFWYTNNNIKVHEREERRRGVRNNRGQGHSS